MNLMTIKNLTKTFGGLIAVNKMTFNVEEGVLCGLIGPNGAGKTTLFNIMSGFYKQDQGDIFFAGENINHLESHERCAKGIARTFQIPKMFPKMSFVDNVLIGALERTQTINIARSEADKIVHFLGMQEKRDLLAGSLSVPELKRLEVAKALATKPKLLLLDEPMGGMNTVEQNEMIDLLRRVHAAGTTIFIVEHVMHAVANLCQQIIVMNSGCKIVEGITQEVLENEEVIKIYLGEED
jgi:branched-chain amino acid transport system ATP-binding protein